MIEKNILIINEERNLTSHEAEFNKSKDIVKDFLETSSANKDKKVEEWLNTKLSEYLPDKNEDEINDITNKITSTLETAEKKSRSLDEALANGRSKEHWLASELKTSTSAMSSQEAAKYLSNLDKAVESANEALNDTIITQSGTVNQNPNLDGFIAEEYHAQTFNMNAEANGSEYRARVVKPEDGVYGKDSVDIEIIDKDGNVVKQYQSKYYKDAESSAEAFEKGNYESQQKLVPEEQAKDIEGASSVLEAPDGTTSNPLSKSKAEQMRDEAQSGNWNDLNWDEYSLKDLSIGVCKQVCYSALQGAAIGAGFDIAEKVWKGDDPDPDEVIEKALKSGAAFGIKAALSGAMKVCSEKEIITILPKGTPASIYANIAHIAVENVKVFSDVASGEISVQEGIEKMEQTTASTVAGLAAMETGASIGASIGSVFGPPGAAIGGFIGGSVGYMAGSKTGELIAKGFQKTRSFATKVVKEIGNAAVGFVKSAASGIGSFCRSVGSGIASLFGF